MDLDPGLEFIFEPTLLGHGPQGLDEAAVQGTMVRVCVITHTGIAGLGFIDTV
jgi:hypothetical protein